MEARHRRTANSAVVLIVALLAALTAGTRPASSFSLETHEGILREALTAGETMTPEALGWVIGRFLGGGNLSSDRYQLAAERHFDNAPTPARICELWDRGVNRFLTKAVELSAPVGPENRALRNRRGALEAFGEATHAIADFYSHTDWVEIHVAQGRTANLPAAALSGRTCVASGFPAALQSGYFNVAHGLDGCPPKPPEGFKYCHSVINKDKADSPHGRQTIAGTNITYYQAARALAVVSTREAWTALRERIAAKYGAAAGECVFKKLAWGGEEACR